MLSDNSKKKENKKSNPSVFVLKISAVAAAAAMIFAGCSQYKKTTTATDRDSSSAVSAISSSKRQQTAVPRKAPARSSAENSAEQQAAYNYSSDQNDDQGDENTGWSQDSENSSYVTVSKSGASLKYAKPGKRNTRGKAASSKAAGSKAMSASASSASSAFSVDTSNLPCLNASAPLKIKTYDGSNQAMHPKVLYFKNKWNGWRYWMSYTPYPQSDATYENPSLAVSQDGISWNEPTGVKNPIVKAPSDVDKGGYNSDPELVMNGKTMQLWYRNDPANKAGNGVDLSHNRIYMISSTDGVKWTEPKLVLDGNYRYYSPAVIYDDNKYEVWFSDDNGDVLYTSSADMKNWSDPVITDLRATDWNAWHQDVIKTDSQYKIVFSAYNTTNKDKKGNVIHGYQCLFYATSSDGISFSKPVMILAPSKDKTAYDNQLIYRSTLVDVDGTYDLYYSAMNTKKYWHTFLTHFDPSSIQITD